uniref:Uncharacterized protein n=1 Tax=Oryza punctata TaxID=4537 RepID=A0A0E0JSM8_ORYPU
MLEDFDRVRVARFERVARFWRNHQRTGRQEAIAQRRYALTVPITIAINSSALAVGNRYTSSLATGKDDTSSDLAAGIDYITSVLAAGKKTSSSELHLLHPCHRE